MSTATAETESYQQKRINKFQIRKPRVQFKFTDSEFLSNNNNNNNKKRFD